MKLKNSKRKMWLSTIPIPGRFHVLSITAFVLISLATLSCASDDAGNPIQLPGVKGTVIKAVSCNTESNGLAYQIAIDNNPDIEFIITGTLPAAFQKAGQEIVFDMKESTRNITFCTANFLPEVFYEISAVQAVSNQN